MFPISSGLCFGCWAHRWWCPGSPAKTTRPCSGGDGAGACAAVREWMLFPWVSEAIWSLTGEQLLTRTVLINPSTLRVPGRPALTAPWIRLCSHSLPLVWLGAKFDLGLETACCLLGHLCPQTGSPNNSASANAQWNFFAPD